MLKNAYFLEKTVKNRLVSEPPNPRLPPSAEGSAHRSPRCNFCLLLQFCPVHFGSAKIVKCVLLPSKKEQNNCSKCSVFASFALFHLFFTSNSIRFVDKERKSIFCPRAQDTLTTPLV